MECYLLGIFNIVSFCLGYLYYHYRATIQFTDNKRTYNNTKNPNIINHNKIDIDESKVVLEINTSDLEKKYDSLGNVSQSNDSISNSINKLQQLKR